MAEQVLFKQLMDLYLEGAEFAFKAWEQNDERTPLMALIVSIFNNFESARVLINKGLIVQSSMPARDAIESVYLVILFANIPEYGARWIKKLVEYEPGDVRSKLKEMGIEFPFLEVYYAILSQMSHPNHLSSVQPLVEREVPEGLQRTFNFGGLANYLAIQQAYRVVILLAFTVLDLILWQIYLPSWEGAREWHDRINHLVPKLQDLESGQTPSESNTPDIEQQHIDELIKKKFKIWKIQEA